MNINKTKYISTCLAPGCTVDTHSLYPYLHTNALIGAHLTHYLHTWYGKPPADGVQSWVSLREV